MTNKKNLIIVAVLALVVGFGAGNLFGFPEVNSSLLKGDISKADLYSNQKEDPELAVYFDKLKNDKEFLKQTQDGMALLKERVSNLNELTTQIVNTCNDIPELQEAVKPIQSLQAKAFNTNNSLDKFGNGLEKVVAGEKAADLEQASNNAFVGFSKIENQLDASKKFVETASEYLKGHENGELDKQIKELAYYCAQDALLNASTENVEYWSDKVGSTTSLGALFDKSPVALQAIEPALKAASPGLLGLTDNSLRDKDKGQLNVQQKENLGMMNKQVEAHHPKLNFTQAPLSNIAPALKALEKNNVQFNTGLKQSLVILQFNNGLNNSKKWTGYSDGHNLGGIEKVKIVQ